MGGKDLDIPPGKEDQVWIKFQENLSQGICADGAWKQGEVQKALIDLWVFLENVAGQISRAYGIDFFAG
jgi:hypothetical protein